MGHQMQSIKEEMGQQLDQKIQSLHSELEMPTLRAKVNEHSDTLAALNSTVEVLKGSEGMIRTLNGCTADGTAIVDTLRPLVKDAKESASLIASHNQKKITNGGMEVATSEKDITRKRR